MKAELKSMKDFEVFEEAAVQDVDPNLLNGAIDSRWVQRWKGIEIKSRLVAKGYTEKIEDLDDVYASTPMLVVLRTLMAIALAMSWKIATADISTAFLHAALSSNTSRATIASV